MGGFLQASQANIQAERDAATAEANAVAGRERAGIQVSQTKSDVERASREARARGGSARAAAGASGGLSGSALDIISSNAIQDELDILTIKQQGKIAEKDLLSGARIDILQSETARRSGGLNTAAGILQGTAEVAQLALAASSDRRLKQDIKKVDKKNGFNIYEFAYKTDPTKRYRGVMAQEVLDIMPEAVVMKHGYYAVHYEMLGLTMEAI